MKVAQKSSLISQKKKETREQQSEPNFRTPLSKKKMFMKNENCSSPNKKRLTLITIQTD